MEIGDLLEDPGKVLEAVDRFNEKQDKKGK